MPDIYMDVDVALSEVPVNVMSLIDDTDFKTREESVTYNQAGLDLVWNFQTTAGSRTQTAVTPTDTGGDYDWVNQGNGDYTIEIPASGGASINNDTEGFGWFEGFATGILPWKGPIIGFRSDIINDVMIDVGAPATQAQVDNIGAASGGSVNINISEDNTGGTIDPSSAVFVGSVQGATTFANLEAADGVVHDIDDDGDDIDIVYGCSVGGGRTGSLVSIIANVDGNTDEIKVKAYDHVGGDWEIIGTVEGSGGTSFKALDLDLLLKHTGTSTELGKVYIRFETDTTTPSNLSIDKLIVRAVNIGQTVGYANGRIWVDTVNGVAGTEAFVNGVADNPVKLIANAKNLSTSVGISDFHIINGSAITLAESTTNESYFGDNWTLALGGVDVDEAYFQGAHVSGVGTSTTEVHYEGCDVATMSVQIGHFDFCSFDGTVTHTLAGDYEYHNCYSNIAGDGAPTFTKTAGQTITAEWRNWMDGITVSGLQSGDAITINGRLGTVTLNGADASVEIRGSYKSIVNNLTGSATVNIAGAWIGSDIADTLADTNELQGDWTNGGRLDLLLDAIPTAITTAHTTTDDLITSSHVTTDALITAIKAVTDDMKTLDTTIASVTTPDTVFTLAAGLTGNDDINNAACSIYDETGGVWSGPRRVSDYVHGSLTVTIDANTAFPLAAGDRVVIWNVSYATTAAAGSISPGDIADIVDGVWDETETDHLTKGTTGARQYRSDRVER